jgi:beta-lactamase class A
MTVIGRRALLARFGGVALAGIAVPPALAASEEERASDALYALEARAGGRLGVAFLDGKLGLTAGHRRNERFTMCSTFKLSLAAAVLARIDAGTLRATLPVPLCERDVVGHSPAVKAALPQGALSILALAEAAQVVSDNGAANLLLRQIGGPEALTRFWNNMGDDVSRLDRYEPDLNTSHGEDYRDTTSPAAMADSMTNILTGTSVLNPDSRERLIRWMVATTTGANRLRAGLPQGWRAGDKTGTMAGDDTPLLKINDIAAVWRPDGSPIFITAFYEPPEGTPVSQAETVLAEVGRIARDWMTRRN